MSKFITIFAKNLNKMLQIGKINELEITHRVDFGLYLDGGEAGEILLPLRYATRDM